ncbi:HAMP domain-containing sensor histidine kinase [Phenylobacterium sp.]|uniref:sensor histidine kinase n=1 Tax=Phenylobacterium sp. TaxID=1871053 RepID=UPI002EDAAB33
MTAKPGRPRLSIGLQLVLLILACLAATHVVVFAAIAVLPPPRPPIYRLSEIAGALQGGPLETRFGRPMVRSIEATAPALRSERGRRSGRAGEALAVTLGRPRAEVRFAPVPPSAVERMFRPERGFQIVFAHRARLGDGPPPPPPPPPAPGPERFEIPLPPPHAFHAREREMVLGDFTAALRRPDGRWTVVRSTPEPFPTEWQKRAGLILLAGFVVVAPAGLLFARRITAPLKRFSEAAERLGRDPHAPPVTLAGPAEIGAAAEAFNNMQARLRRYIDDRTATLGAISHDLRTPLSRIRFKLEGADPKVRDAVLSDVAQMEQMIQGVLTLIRDESTPRTREKLDLLSLVECVADDAAMVGGDVEILAGQPITVEGDPVALQRMFVNLVDNAVKYAGQARLRVSHADGHAVVDVIDEGPGLSDADREKVFQPFYRVDAARNLDDGGMGLGLPIARSTARAHGGDVELLPTAKGLVARVTLPAA